MLPDPIHDHPAGERSPGIDNGLREPEAPSAIGKSFLPLCRKGGEESRCHLLSPRHRVAPEKHERSIGLRLLFEDHGPGRRRATEVEIVDRSQGAPHRIPDSPVQHGEVLRLFEGERGR